MPIAAKRHHRRITLALVKKNRKTLVQIVMLLVVGIVTDKMTTAAPHQETVVGITTAMGTKITFTGIPQQERQEGSRGGNREKG